MVQQSNQIKQHILLTLAGSTPQIVTETLYALMIKEGIPISEVYVVTTKMGKETALRTLAEENGEMARFCREYDLAAGTIAFTPQHIITIKKADKTELEDIRTSEDNELFGKQLLSFIEKITVDPQTTLYCSIAGGRKTMSAYLMLAMTLFGRPQDRLMHVLVHEDFESCEDFFFPPASNQVIALPKGSRKAVLRETKDAGIELGNIPFVKLRTILSKASFKELRKGVEELVEAAQSEVAEAPQTRAKLVIDLRNKAARYGGHKVEKLEPAKLVFLAYYADRKKNFCVEPERTMCGECKSCFQSDDEINRERYFDLIRAQHNALRFGSAEDKIRQLAKSFADPS